jgi:uncharacterized protein with NRDE domain
MCLMAFALTPHPGVGLLLAANRDETLSRPTAALDRWRTPAGIEVLAGRDLRDGGTWLGCTAEGRVAMLTNVRDGPPGPAARRSRGELVTRWLDGEQNLMHTLDAQAYGGFNLVLGHLPTGEWTWLNNRPGTVWAALPATIQALTRRNRPGLLVARLPAGVYGLSNAGLNTPWPKTLALQQTMARVAESWHPPPSEAGASLADNEATLCGTGQPRDWQASLWQALNNRSTYPDALLPQTGVPPEWERALSATRVDAASLDYGTRTSLVLSATRHADGSPWHICMEERTHATGTVVQLET